MIGACKLYGFHIFEGSNGLPELYGFQSTIFAPFRAYQWWTIVADKNKFHHPTDEMVGKQIV